MATIRELTKRLTTLEQQRKSKAVSAAKQFWTEIVTWSGIIIKRFRSKNGPSDRLILPPKEEIERSHELNNTPPDEMGWAEEIERLDRELGKSIELRLGMLDMD